MNARQETAGSALNYHCHCEEPTGDVAIRILSGALHRPSPKGTESERIATAYGLAMTVVVDGWSRYFPE